MLSQNLVETIKGVSKGEHSTPTLLAGDNDRNSALLIQDRKLEKEQWMKELRLALPESKNHTKVLPIRMVLYSTVTDKEIKEQNGTQEQTQKYMRI